MILSHFLKTQQSHYYQAVCLPLGSELKAMFVGFEQSEITEKIAQVCHF